MSVRVVPAVVATSCAVLVALLAFVPYVAREYRTRGEFGAGGLVWRFALLLYVLGLTAYVLVPLPPDSFCARSPALSPQLRPLASFDGVVAEFAHGAGLSGLLVDDSFWQVGLNVVLFLPLGVFARSSGRRRMFGVLVIGGGTSLVIELTQLTGVWFLHPCPYRLFDVDDLIANTLGALLGGAVARPRRRSERCPAPAEAPRPVTANRRLLGMTCDLLLLWWIGGTVSRIFHLTLSDRTFGGGVVGRGAVGDGAVGDARRGGSATVDGPGFSLVDTWLEPSLSWFVPAVLLLLITVLGGGSSLGQHAVLLRAVGPRGAPDVGAVCRRWVVGVGGLGILEGLVGGLGFEKVWLPAALSWCAMHGYGVIRGGDARGFGDRFGRTALVDARHAGAPDAFLARRAFSAGRARFSGASGARGENSHGRWPFRVRQNGRRAALRSRDPGHRVRQRHYRRAFR